VTLLRIYGPDECGLDGYPYAWHHGSDDGIRLEPPIKDLIREQAGYRCERCGHPYPPGITMIFPRGEWTPCDDRCRHEGPIRHDLLIQAQWRILTVHHLNGVKYDCRWWNLPALCQRCHLSIQSRVVMERAFILEHSEWFKPFAAGWYADKYLGEDLTREETMARLDELLALERLDTSENPASISGP
jgi:hypothetical protein